MRERQRDATFASSDPVQSVTSPAAALPALAQDLGKPHAQSRHFVTSSVAS